MSDTKTENAGQTLAASGLLADLKAKYESLVEQEREHRAGINAMRRELTRICKQRRAAKKAWNDECTRLVG